MDILLVEDETNLADVIARNLRAHAFSVSIALTAEDALAELGQSRPDILLLDITFPTSPAGSFCAK